METAYASATSASLATCPISLEPIVTPKTLACGHTFEEKNIDEWLSTESEGYFPRPKTCPVCRAPVSTTAPSPKGAIEMYYALQRRRVEEIIREAVDEINNEALRRDMETLQESLRVANAEINDARRRREVERALREAGIITPREETRCFGPCVVM